MEKSTNTFIGCDSDYNSAKVAIFGAPFDGTASYRPGSRFAPSAMRAESFGIETYSPYLDKDLQDINVFDCGDLDFPFGNPKRVVEIIENFTKKLLQDGKKPCMIGGEHLVSLGAIKACADNYDNLHIIHFDAHADLRDEYFGEKLSHASVIRRSWDIIGDNKIFQFGIRSGCREEFEWGKNHIFTNKFDFNGLKEAVEKIGDNPVYFTIDLDVLDPSEFMGTGTPEAGGVSFIQLLQASMDVFKLNIVGFDINELAPNYDQSGASTALACKLLRELLLLAN